MKVSGTLNGPSISVSHICVQYSLYFMFIYLVCMLLCIRINFRTKLSSTYFLNLLKNVSITLVAVQSAYDPSGKYQVGHKWNFFCLLGFLCVCLLVGFGGVFRLFVCLFGWLFIFSSGKLGTCPTSLRNALFRSLKRDYSLPSEFHFSHSK